jgi:hypothetical protein
MLELELPIVACGVGKLLVIDIFSPMVAFPFVSEHIKLSDERIHCY